MEIRGQVNHNNSICIEFPTNKAGEIEYIGKIIDQQDQYERFHAVVIVDGKVGEELYAKYANFHPRVHCVLISNPIVIPLSMTELRLAGARQAQAFGFGWGIMTDGDVLYGSTAFEFIEETIQLLPSKAQAQEMRVWCNLRGFFGSSGPGGKVLIPRQLPLGTNNGIIYNFALRKGLVEYSPPALPGGCEDPMLTTWFTARLGAVPFRRFKAPIRHPKKSNEHYNKSAIHDKSIMENNNFKLMKEIWQSVGLDTSSWGGIPDNMEQSGFVLPNGKKLSASCPGVGRWVENEFGKHIELAHWRNW